MDVAESSFFDDSTTGEKERESSNKQKSDARNHSFASAATAVRASLNRRSSHSPPPFLNVQRVELQRLCLRGKLRARHFDFYEDVEALANQFLVAAEQLLNSMTLQPEPRVTCLSRQSERWVSIKLAVNTVPVARIVNPSAFPGSGTFGGTASQDFAQ